MRLAEPHQREKHHDDAGFSQAGTYASRADFSDLKWQVNSYIRCVPVLGFNSQKYDLNIIKIELVKRFINVRGDIDFVIKKYNSSRLAISDFLTL